MRIIVSRGNGTADCTMEKQVDDSKEDTNDAD
jgi:hypothetical protein